jgi:glycogen operon protein
VNFLTSHDGFTLRDLVSYNAKHNEANNERNRDGDDANYSWNSGAEGPTDDPAVEEIRRRRSRAMLATLLLSTGVPMLTAGDERGRTQRGNNNAYCQDNRISWVDWASSDRTLVDLVRLLTALRRDHPVFRRAGFFVGDTGNGTPVDIRWYAPDGSPMDAGSWQSAEIRTLGVLLDGRATSPADATFFLVFNAGDHLSEVVLPETGGGWEVVVDTADLERTGSRLETSAAVEPFTVLVLRAP